MILLAVFCDHFLIPNLLFVNIAAILKPFYYATLSWI